MRDQMISWAVSGRRIRRAIGRAALDTDNCAPDYAVLLIFAGAVFTIAETV